MRRLLQSKLIQSNYIYYNFCLKVFIATLSYLQKLSLSFFTKYFYKFMLMYWFKSLQSLLNLVILNYLIIHSCWNLWIIFNFRIGRAKLRYSCILPSSIFQSIITFYLFIKYFTYFIHVVSTTIIVVVKFHSNTFWFLTVSHFRSTSVMF